MTIICPHCSNDDRSLMERVPLQVPTYYCMICAREFIVKEQPKEKP